MPSWRGISGNGQYLMNLNKLISADNLHDFKQGNAENAYTK